MFGLVLTTLTTMNPKSLGECSHKLGGEKETNLSWIFEHYGLEITFGAALPPVWNQVASEVSQMKPGLDTRDSGIQAFPRPLTVPPSL